MTAIAIDDLDYKTTFNRDYKKAPPEVQLAANEAVRGLLLNPQPAKLRTHSLNGYFHPRIFKIDVTPNKAWQITFEISGTTAVLRRLCRHKDIDRNP